MADNHKTVKWIGCSAFNPHKKEKIGWIKGTVIDLQMDISIIRFLGLVDYLKQMFFFARSELK